MRHWVQLAGEPGLESRFREGLIRLRIEAVLRELATLDDTELDAVVAKALSLPKLLKN